jgi:hypothetical protein
MANIGDVTESNKVPIFPEALWIKLHGEKKPCCASSQPPPSERIQERFNFELRRVELFLSSFLVHFVFCKLRLGFQTVLMKGTWVIQSLSNYQALHVKFRRGGN